MRTETHVLNGTQQVQAWMHGAQVDNLVVVSPHLDDAVLSVAGLLRTAAPKALVLTIFTEATPQSDPTWSRMTGFDTPMEEYEARRQEDLQAMRFLGCAFQHAGLRVGELQEESARLATQAVLDSVARAPASTTLCLLPAASGGHQPESPSRRLLRRLLRRPFGSPAHSEHVWVRNQLWQSLRGHPIRLGFYADLPYAWQQGDAGISAELTQLTGQPLHALRLRPDLDDKLKAVEHYRSQVPRILGGKPAYQRRVLDRDECLFLL